MSGCCPLGQRLDRDAIDPVGPIGLALRLVHRRIGGGVDQHFRTFPSDDLQQRFDVLQVDIRSRKSHDFTERGECSLQLPADLTVPSQDQKLHA